MANILMISSWVAHGHVGLSASALAAQQLGHSVTQVPTILLSNHPGWSHVDGVPIPIEQLLAMLSALEKNDFLKDLDAVLVGYMPSTEHVDAISNWLEERRSALRCRILVDPILGDEPGGLYVPENVALAIRSKMCPVADVLTPNGFELAWLTGGQIAGAGAIVAAARSLPCDEVLVTSVPAGKRIAVHWVTGSSHKQWMVAHQAGVPHGVGDALAGLLASGNPIEDALGYVSALISASLGAPHLRIAEAAPTWTQALPLPYSAIEEV